MEEGVDVSVGMDCNPVPHQKESVERPGWIFSPFCRPPRLIAALACRAAQPPLLTHRGAIANAPLAIALGTACAATMVFNVPIAARSRLSRQEW